MKEAATAATTIDFFIDLLPDLRSTTRRPQLEGYACRGPDQAHFINVYSGFGNRSAPVRCGRAVVPDHLHRHSESQENGKVEQSDATGLLAQARAAWRGRDRGRSGNPQQCTTGVDAECTAGPFPAHLRGTPIPANMAAIRRKPKNAVRYSN
jgi:hypothetical protein